MNEDKAEEEERLDRMLPDLSSLLDSAHAGATIQTRGWWWVGLALILSSSGQV